MNNNHTINKPKKFDLEERTTKFGKNVIIAIKKVKINSINKRIIEQLTGSSGSIGANYSEANEAESKKDFIHKISISKKEAKETNHWLKLLKTSNPEISSDIDILLQENKELVLIFSKIISSSRKRK